MKMSRPLPSVLLGSSALAVAVLFATGGLEGCSSTPTSTTDGGTTTTPDASVADVTTPAVDATPPPPVDASVPDTSKPPPKCDNNGFTSVANDGFVKSSDGTVGVVGQTTLASPVDTIELDLLPLTGTAVTVGKRTLTPADASYDTCKTCVLIRTKCDQNLSNCEKTFMAQEGSVDVTTFGGKGGKLDATVSVTMVEVTLDAKDKATPVAGGKSWCLTGHKVVVDKLQ